jgi:hypothetical protein
VRVQSALWFAMMIRHDGDWALLALLMWQTMPGSLIGRQLALFMYQVDVWQAARGGRLLGCGLTGSQPSAARKHCGMQSGWCTSTCCCVLGC